MRIILYVNNAEENRLDKTSFLVQVADLSGTLRAGSSVVNPSILVELPSVDANELVGDDEELVLGDSEEIEILGASDAIPIFNYAFIPEFHRYYFITDSVSVKNRLYMLTMRSDPLMSFKDSILNQSAIIDRCEDENLYDVMLKDEERPLDTSKFITITEPSVGSLVNFSWDFSKNMNLRRYLLNTLSRDTTAGFRDNEMPSPTFSLPEIGAVEISSIQGIDCYVLNYDIVNEVAKALFDDDTKSSFVASCVFFPFEITTDLGRMSGNYQIWTGDDRIEKVGHAGEYLSGNGYKYGTMLPYLVAMDYTFPEIESFLDFGYFNLFEIYIPFVGYVEIPYERIAGKHCILYYALSSIDGAGSVVLYNLNERQVLYSASVQVGIPLSFSTTNQRELQNAETALALNTSIGILTSIIATGAGAVSGNPVAIAGGVISGAKTLNQAITGEMSLLPKAQSNVSSPKAGLQMPDRVYFRQTRTTPIFALNDSAGAEYKRTHGVPSLKRASLSAITGFARIGNIHLENIPAMDSEINSILSSLSSGVIF